MFCVVAWVVQSTCLSTVERIWRFRKQQDVHWIRLDWLGPRGLITGQGLVFD